MAGISEGSLLWKPSPELQQQSNMAAYIEWLKHNHGLNFRDYGELWRWSVGELEKFWATIYQFFGIPLRQPFRTILANRSMPGARWFEGAELNYAEQVLRQATPTRPALIFRSETEGPREVSWAALESETAHVSAALRGWGVQPGDRVAAYMPNIPETVSAFLGSAAAGAVWSSCSPDFGISAVVDRFAQIEPRVLFAVDGYSYGGKRFDRTQVLRELLQALPTVEQVVLVPYLDGRARYPGATLWQDLQAGTAPPLTFEPLPYGHPLWILYSSGTTGLPKGLVHGHGGVVFEHLKALALHCDLHPGDKFFWHTSTGWMMWNFIVSGLLTGATTVLYDGSPGYPDLNVLWEYAQQAGTTLFGTSAAYITACMKAGIEPGRDFTLNGLKCIGSTGSPLPVEGFDWSYGHIKQDLWLASISGGTDVVSAFVGGCPLLPVYAGELQCRMLGCDVQAFDERGRPLTGETGELVLTKPMPSMPLYFWNDPDGRRYRDAYFDLYPGVWRHGDWIRINAHGGSVIEGRSDSTLNRQGVRMGSSEIYAAVEALPEVDDSLVIGVEQPDGGYYMPLFVMLANGATGGEDLSRKIKEVLRASLSPRHVPDEIIQVPAIPRTLSGKKMEVPVKKLFQGVPLEKAANAGATADPQALRYFEQLAQERRKTPVAAAS